MAKISNEAKQRYNENVKEYKSRTEEFLEREKNVLKTISAENPTDAAFKRLTLADERMNLASYYLLLNRISVSLLGIKNEAFLNDARKSCYQSVIYLEDVVMDVVDAPFSDYSENLEVIDSYPDEKRFFLAKKLGFTIESVEDDFGENSKWKWSFVELEGRFIAVAKNLVNLKTLIAGLDPRVEGYESRHRYVRLIKEGLQKAADRYRQKYELSTLRIDDFKLAIEYLGALRRLHTILGENDSAEVVKKKTDVWKAKMQTDEKKTAEGA